MCYTCSVCIAIVLRTYGLVLSSYYGGVYANTKTTFGIIMFYWVILCTVELHVLFVLPFCIWKLEGFVVRFFGSSSLISFVCSQFEFCILQF